MDLCNPGTFARLVRFFATRGHCINRREYPPVEGQKTDVSFFLAGSVFSLYKLGLSSVTFCQDFEVKMNNNLVEIRIK